MKTGIVTIGGFKQTERKPVGMDATQRELDALYDQRDDIKVYDMRTWKSDMRGLAALMKRDGIESAIVLAYSHGGGYAAPRLAKELIKRDIYLKLLLLCDPVYRPLWLPRWTIAQVLAFRALIPKSATIKFPAAIGHMYGLRQRANIPQGHKVQIGSGKAKYLPLVQGDCIKHDTIDESDEWNELVHRKVAVYV